VSFATWAGGTNEAILSTCEQSSFEIGIGGQALPAMEKLRVTDTLGRPCSASGFWNFTTRLSPMSILLTLTSELRTQHPQLS